jgi:hypothetical protein
MENEDVRVAGEKPPLTPQQKKIIRQILRMQYRKRLKTLGVI